MSASPLADAAFGSAAADRRKSEGGLGVPWPFRMRLSRCWSADERAALKSSGPVMCVFPCSVTTRSECEAWYGSTISLSRRIKGVIFVWPSGRHLRPSFGSASASRRVCRSTSDMLVSHGSLLPESNGFLPLAGNLREKPVSNSPRTARPHARWKRAPMSFP